MKLTKQQIRRIMHACEERAMRFADANMHIRTNNYGDESGARSKFSIPDNVFLDADYVAEYSEFTEHLNLIQRVVRQNATEDQISSLEFLAEEMLEIDLGWIIWGQPLGYYGLRPGELWKNIELSDALLALGGFIQNDAVFDALESQFNQSAPTRLDSVCDNLRTGADPMQDIRDLLGSALTTEGLQ